jgi:hypothetical protein
MLPVRLYGQAGDRAILVGRTSLDSSCASLAIVAVAVGDRLLLPFND